MKKKGSNVLQDSQRKRSFHLYIRRNINPQRLIRALEVKLSTGNSILSYRKKYQKKRTFDIVQIGLQLPKDQLHRNIDARVESMMEPGLASEVKELLPWRHLNSLRTVGYTELFDWIDGKLHSNRLLI